MTTTRGKEKFPHFSVEKNMKWMLMEFLLHLNINITGKKNLSPSHSHQEGIDDDDDVIGFVSHAHFTSS